MKEFALEEGTEVQTQIRDPLPVEEKYDDRTAVIKSVHEDDLGDLVGDPKESIMYRLVFLDGSTLDVRHNDIK